MALHRLVGDRFRPWYVLLGVVFLAASAWSIRDATSPLSLPALLYATLEGLLWTVGFQFTVGAVWAYAVEYRAAGGDWTDAPFVAPFVVAVLAGAAAVAAAGGDRTQAVAVAAWAGFWAFVVAVAVLAVLVWVARGYREAAA
jgi:hypothetical protein